MKYNVLVIESQAQSMRLLKRVIGKANLQAVCAESLTEAKHIFSHSAPESYLCAVIDYALPDAPHGEAIDFALESYIPVIAMTDGVQDDVRANVLSRNVVDYIPKENAQVYEYLSKLLSRLEKNKQVGVLVIEENRRARNRIVSLLQRHNFLTFSAPSATIGMDLLHLHEEIKLLLTAENLSDRSGVDLVAEIRKTFSKDELGILGIVPSDRQALPARFIKSGANDFLTTDFSHEEFLCRVLQNIEHIEHIETIQTAANTDFLTGLANRRQFFSQVSAILKREPSQMSLAILDLDHFKQVNDTYGHDGGDYVLQQVAQAIKTHFGRFLPARFGGEEFCIFFAEQDACQAKQFLETFAEEIRNKQFNFAGKGFRCSVSIGLTERFDQSIESMLKYADENLYSAKRNGRDQIVADS